MKRIVLDENSAFAGRVGIMMNGNKNLFFHAGGPARRAFGILLPCALFLIAPVTFSGPPAGPAYSRFCAHAKTAPALARENDDYRITRSYTDKRNAFFSSAPEGAGRSGLSDNRIHGVLVDIGRRGSITTLIVMKDGRVSVWSGAGCGVAGAGKNENAKKLAARFLAESETCMRFAAKTKARDLPGRGEAVFYFLTTDRIYRLRAGLADLAGEKSQASPLFALAKQLMSEAEKTDQTAVKSRRMGMVLCVKCNEKFRNELKGDGECVKHGPFSFSMEGLAVPCTRCAAEKGVCQMCGRPVCDIVPE
jgi:hypothetical protein